MLRQTDKPAQCVIEDQGVCNPADYPFTEKKTTIVKKSKGPPEDQQGFEKSGKNFVCINHCA